MIRIGPAYTAEQLDDPENKSRILNLLQSADFGVVEAHSEEEELNIDDLKDKFSAKFIEEISSSEEGKKLYERRINLVHQSNTGEPVIMDFKKEESAGTRRFFSLIGPWLDILKNGYTVFIDEIDTSLHPNLVKELLKLLFCQNITPVVPRLSSPHTTLYFWIKH